jgi:hypothetical protein
MTAELAGLELRKNMLDEYWSNKLQMIHWPSIEDTVKKLLKNFHNLHKLVLYKEDYQTKTQKANETVVALYEMLPDIVGQLIEGQTFHFTLNETKAHTIEKVTSKL